MIRLLCISQIDKEILGKDVFALVTSNFFTNSFAVGADTIIWRALGLINPSSTALSINDSSEL